jgi:photosystem II stability/assembly factor-like uncharacterized protein
MRKSQTIVLDDCEGELATTCDEAGCNPYLYPPRLLRTTDGGQSWEFLQPQLRP